MAPGVGGQTCPCLQCHLAPRWELVLRHLARAFRNQNSGRAKNPGYQNRNPGNKGNWAARGAWKERKFSLEAVGTKSQDSMEIKSLGQKGPSCHLFFRGARLVGPQQAVPGAAFTPLEGSRDPISGLWKFLGGVFGVCPQAALFPLTSLASPFLISSPYI